MVKRYGKYELHYEGADIAAIAASIAAVDGKAAEACMGTAEACWGDMVRIMALYELNADKEVVNCFDGSGNPKWYCRLDGDIELIAKDCFDNLDGVEEEYRWGLV